MADQNKKALNVSVTNESEHEITDAVYQQIVEWVEHTRDKICNNTDFEVTVGTYNSPGVKGIHVQLKFVYLIPID